MSSLTRRVYRPPSAGLLDFLAPWTSTSNTSVTSRTLPANQKYHSAAFSTGASLSTPPSDSKPRPTPSQPTNQQNQPARSARSSPKLVRSGKQKSDGRNDGAAGGKPPRRKPVETHRASPSSLELLSAIRAYVPPAHRPAVAPSSSAPTPQPVTHTSTPLADAHAAHNQAILNLISGSQSGLFDLAFTAGWRPIRNSGQAGRLKPADLAKVLEAAGRALGQPHLKASWAEVKELVLWLCGEGGMPGVDRWASREVEKGTEGAQRVVQVWEALVAGDHLALRVSDNAPDVNSKDPVALPLDLDAAATSLLPLASFRFYSSYIFARAIVHSSLTPSTRPSFRSLLPSLVHPRAPQLKHMRDSALPQLHPDKFDNAADSFAFAKRWRRQVSLAQTWHRAPGGLVVVRQLNGSLRRAQVGEAWELWEAVQEAVESEEVAWLTDRWAASSNKKWVDDREEQEALSGVWGQGEEARAGAEVEAVATEEGTATAGASEVAPSTDTPAPAARQPFSPDDAHFTQAHVAPFLAGFAKLRMLTHANAIWVWLHARGLAPGVVAWTGLIAGYASRGDVNAVEATWSQMIDGGVRPDGWAYLERSRAYFVAKLPDDAMRVADALLADKHAVASFSGGVVSPLVYTTLIGGLLANGRHDEARGVLDKMGPQLNIHAVNLLLRRVTQSRKPDFAKVVEMLRFVSERDLQPDVVTFTMVLQALLAMGQRDAPTRLISIMESMGLKPSTTTYGAIIYSLARTGHADELKAAVEVLNEMERNGQPTNEVIYTSLIQGFLRAGAADPSAEDGAGHHPYYQAALTLKDRMEARGLHLNRVGFNALIAAGLALRSEWGTALALDAFRALRRAKGVGARAGGDQREIQRDGSTVGAADTWFVLLDGLAQQGDWGRAREALGEMERAGFEVRTARLRTLVDTVQRGGWVR